MAAWLAFLKSRLLLPPDPDRRRALGRGTGRASGVSAGTVAGDARCGRPLMARDQLGRDFFARGHTRRCHAGAQGDLYRDAAGSDAGLCAHPHPDEFRPFVMDRDAVFTMEQALERMRGLIGFAGDWTRYCRAICPRAGTAIRRAGARPRRRPLRPRWNWSKRASWRSGRPRPSRRSSCGKKDETHVGRYLKKKKKACSKRRRWPSRNAWSRRSCLPPPSR